MQTKQRRITSILIALAVLLVSSISVLALNMDEYDTHKATGSECIFSTVTSGNTSVTLVESDYSTRNLEFNTAGYDEENQLWYNEMLGSYDPSEKAVWYFSGQGSGTQWNDVWTDPDQYGNILRGTKVYDDSELTNAVASYGNGLSMEGVGNGHFNIFIEENVLENGKTYYLCISDVYLYRAKNNNSNTWDKDIVFKFETTAAPVEDPVANQDYTEFQTALNATPGIDLYMFMTTPEYTNIKTAGEQTYEDGTKYWFNEIVTPLDANKDQVFAMDISGTGAQHLANGRQPVSNVSDHYKILDSENKVVACTADNTMIHATAGTRVSPDEAGGTAGNGANIAVTVPAGTLENGKTYYFVADKDVWTNASDRVTKTDYVFKFTTAEASQPALELTSSKETLTKNDTTKLTVENGLEGYTYEFKVQNNETKAWWTIQKRSEKNYCNWYAGPAAAEKEGKTIYATVYDADGNKVETLEKTLYVKEIESTLEIEAYTSSIPIGTLTKDSTTVLTAKAKGGTAPYSYRFRVNRNGTDIWYTMQNYKEGDDNETWWAGPTNDQKTVFIDVKDADGNTAQMVLTNVMASNLS